MNIAIINVKDLFKYILKFFVIIILVLILTNGIKGIIDVKQTANITKVIEENTSKISNKSFTKCLDISIPLMSYKKEENKTNYILTNKKIISMESGILDEKLLRNTDLVIEEQELTTDDVEELQNEIVEIPKDVTVESVSENNIVPRVTDSYRSVKINNQSDYEITEYMLAPDVEITNKKDILIYHTHTCESYTPSNRIRIRNDRKL